MTGRKPVQRKETEMAVLKAFPKGSTEPIQWALHDEVDTDVVARKLRETIGELVRLHTTTGWVLLDPAPYAAFELIT